MTVKQAIGGAWQAAPLPVSQPEQSELDVNIERLNLFYDLLQIEIEKLRRKSIDEVIASTLKEQEPKAE